MKFLSPLVKAASRILPQERFLLATKPPIFQKFWKDAPYMKRKRNIRGFILRTFAATLLSCLVFVALSFSGKAASSSSQSKTLTFAERVAYQRAIEEVYWRHRIWPESADPKPSLNDVMSQAQ